MRRIATIAVLIVMLIMLGAFPALCLDTSLKVYDEASLFTDSELSQLQERAQELSEGKNLDVVILTINDAQGKTSMAYADDYYDYNGFGYGGDNSGLLLLIDMDNRKSWISTTGRAIHYFNDSAINNILDNITGYLSDENYASAADTFLDKVESTPTNGFEKSAQNILIYLLVAIGVAGICVGIMSINNKGRKTTNHDTYLDKNSIVLSDNRDIYIRTAVTKRHIDTSSGGGSSTHTGSSGTSHGGGGRSF